MMEERVYLPVSELNLNVSVVLNRAVFGGERLVITSRGKPKAAIISLADLERFEELEDAQAAREALAEYRAGNMADFVPWEQAKAELAEARQALAQKAA